MKAATPIRVISLFSGCGGLDLGFASEGYRIVFANDSDKDAVKVYIRNKRLFRSPDVSVVCDDIWRILDSGYPFPKAQVVKGGFPCQGFSLAGKRRLDDSRNQLYRAMKEVIRRVGPEVFVAENVRGLENIAGGEVLRRIVEELQELGYYVHTYLLDAVDFGVPQYRERLFIIGSRFHREALTILETHESQSRYASNGTRLGFAQLSLPIGEPTILPPSLTVRDAIGDLENVPLGLFPDHSNGVKYPRWYEKIIPLIGEGQRLYNFRHDKDTVVHTWEVPGNHYGESATRDEVKLMEALSRHRRLKKYYVPGFVDGSPMNADDLAEILGWSRGKVEELVKSLTKKRHLRERVADRFDFRYGTYNQYQRLAWNQPARTLVTNVGNPRNMLHPVRHRALTVRECARLMSFPDQFRFGDDISPESKYRMLGNAVPPSLARAIAKAMRCFFDSSHIAAEKIIAHPVLQAPLG